MTLLTLPYAVTKNGNYSMDSDMEPLGTLKKLWEWDKVGTHDYPNDG